jgi:hypothetical protein
MHMNGAEPHWASLVQGEPTLSFWAVLPELFEDELPHPATAAKANERTNGNDFHMMTKPPQ